MVLVGMGQFDRRRRQFCVSAFYEIGRSYRRLYCTEHGILQIGKANLIKIWIRRFEQTSSTFKPQAESRPKLFRTADNNKRLKQSVRVSARKRLAALHLS